MAPRCSSLQEQIDRYSVPEPNTGCTLWIGYTNDLGYGVLTSGGKQLRAHRAAYELAKGDIPGGMHVLHRCDVRCCVNPDHLFAGTHLDNIADKVAKSRQAQGETSGGAKLTEDEVRQIRASSAPTKKLAELFAVGCGQIRHIRRGLSWRNIPIGA